MAFLFRNKQKNNLELTRSVKELTLRLGQEDKPNPKVRPPNHYEGHAKHG
jgi:calcium binding protein 39